MIPVNNDSHPDVAIVTSSSSPGVNVLVTETPVPIVSGRGAGNQAPPSNSGDGSGSSFGTSLPAFPALLKTHSMSVQLLKTENDRIRKRTSSGEDDADKKAKQASMASQGSNCNVVIRPAHDRFGFKAMQSSTRFS